VAAATALGLVLLVATAYAGSAGRLDPSFGHDGKVVVRDARGEARAVAVGGHKRIVVVGDTGVDDVHHDDAFIIARLFSHGNVDNRFGHHGVVTLRFGAYWARATSVAIGRKGGIVVAGTVCSDADPQTGTPQSCHFGVTRLQRNGDIDRDFGNDGIVEIDFPKAFDYARSVALGAGGRIVLAGSGCDANVQDCDIALAALRRDGSLDPRFGDGGKVVSSIARPGDRCRTGRSPIQTGSVYGMALDSRDRIVVGAQCKRRGRAVLTRFKRNGERDRSFGTGGIVDRKLGIVRTTALVIDSRDRIDVAGRRGKGVAVARIRSTGRLDRSFGKDGTAKISAFDEHRVDLSSVAIDSHGRIVVGGPHIGGFAFARFKRNGHVDRGFGRRGRVIVALRGGGTIAVDRRDRIIGSGNQRYLALVRLLG
jgi:uncharacterized delta-60 repeat protein